MGSSADSLTQQVSPSGMGYEDEKRWKAV